MRIPIIPILLACLAAQQASGATPTPTPTPTLTVFTPATSTATATHLAGTLAMSTPQAFTLTYQQESGPILTVQGIEFDQVSERQSVHGLSHYTRPEKPDTVKITLYTKDGKQWHAQWVEGAP